MSARQGERWWNVAVQRLFGFLEHDFDYELVEIASHFRGYWAVLRCGRKAIVLSYDPDLGVLEGEIVFMYQEQAEQRVPIPRALEQHLPGGDWDPPRRVAAPDEAIRWLWKWSDGLKATAPSSIAHAPT